MVVEAVSIVTSIMGGTNSCPLPRYGWCIRAQNPNVCKENHTSTPLGKKGHKRNLSAAFNLSNMGNEYQVEQVDINRASEEELMTLPLINRQTAHNIVEYRRQIGGFKKVEDIALVSGVGATRLNVIRPEICVIRKKTSQNSSPVSSKMDLSQRDDVSRASANGRTVVMGYHQINVNTANVFHLMKVKGVTQTLAENIVAYRDKKGVFKSLDELVKVKGVKPAILSAIRPYLVLTDELHTEPVVHVNGGIPGSSNGPTIAVPTRHQNGHATVEKLTKSTSQKRVTPTSILGSQEDLISLYGPIGTKSFRSKKKPVLFRKNNRHVVRVATWNLQSCDLQKAENPGVKEVLAMTILENGSVLILC